MYRLEEEKLKARALAQAAAQVQIQAQVKKVLDEEKAALQKSLKEAIMKERMNTEDERLIAQYYVRHFVVTRCKYFWLYTLEAYLLKNHLD